MIVSRTIYFVQKKNSQQQAITEVYVLTLSLVICNYYRRNFDRSYNGAFIYFDFKLDFRINVVNV